ncbi:MAG: hypothetical protein IJH20_02195 [Bacilli bacterium]|nr:hypothetical protein [Bacilli bacterium]
MGRDIFKYYALSMYQQVINEKQIQLDSYKTYDTRDDKGIILFISYDIKSIEMSNNVFVNNVNYTGNLSFYYDESKNFITIVDLPSISYNFDTFKIFSDDILNIIKKIISKYTSIEDVKISMNPFLVFAYSNNVKKYLREASNISLIDSIVRKMNIVIDSLSRKIINDKKKRDEELEKQQRILEKRKTLFELKKEDFKSIDEYIKTLNEKIVEYAKSNYKKYDRHYQINIKKLMIIFQEEFELAEKLEEALFNPEEYFIWEDLFDMEEYLKWEDDREEGIKKYKEILNNVRRIVSEYVEAIGDNFRKITQDRFDAILEIHPHADPYDPDLDREIMFQHDFNKAFDEECSYYQSQLEDEETYPYIKKLFCNKYREYDDYIYYFLDKYFPKQIKILNLTMLVYRSQEKMKKYKEYIENPNLFYDFGSKRLWSVIMEFPYFLRLGCGYNSVWEQRYIYSLIIKPGVKRIDYDNLRYFSKNSKYDSFVGSIERKCLGEVKKDYSCDKITITIPSSLELHEIDKVISFGFKNARHGINYVCENIDIANYVKKRIVYKYLNKYTYEGNVFVNVDPKYYDNYFTTLPNNSDFYHQYDYSSNYRYSRKDINSFNVIIEACISYNRFKNNGVINREEVEEQLLGSYGELKYESFNISPYDAIARYLKNEGRKSNIIFPLIDQYLSIDKDINQYLIENEIPRPVNYDEFVKLKYLILKDRLSSIDYDNIKYHCIGRKKEEYINKAMEISSKNRQKKYTKYNEQYIQDFYKNSEL